MIDQKISVDSCSFEDLKKGVFDALKIVIIPVMIAIRMMKDMQCS